MTVDERRIYMKAVWRCLIAGFASKLLGDLIKDWPQWVKLAILVVAVIGALEFVFWPVSRRHRGG